MVLFINAVLATGLGATTYYSKSSGNLNVTTSWGDQTNGSGTNPANFTTSGDIFIVANRSSYIHTTTWVLGSGNRVQIGNGSSAINMVISAPGRILNATVDIASTATLSIGRPSGFITGLLGTASPSSTVVYNVTNAQVLAGTYDNLTIAQNAILQGETFVNNVLTIATSKTLTLNAQNLDIIGTVAGSGQILPDNASGIYVLSNNTGNIGTLNFAGTSPQLNFLDISFSNPSGIVNLGSNLTIIDNGVLFSSFFNHSSGSLNLNGFKLTVDQTALVSLPNTAGDGYIYGSASSTLLMNGQMVGNNTLFMEPSNNTLKVLGFNSPGYTMQAANSLNITDSLSVQDGTIDANDNITLVSTASLKGRLGKLGATADIINNLKVQTFAKGGTTGWAVLGVSGISGQTVASWEGQIPMSCYSCPNDENSVAGQHFVSIQGWNEAGSGGSEYVEMSYTDALTPGIGYWTYLGNGQTSTTDMVWTVSGTAVKGSVPVTLTNSAQTGYNLIANPYASPISWAKVLAVNPTANIQNAIYVYNADLGTTTQYVGGVASPGGTTGITDVIPMGQGFYVQANGNTSLNFTEDVKSSSNTSANPLLKAQQNNIGDVFRLSLTGTNGDYDETVFRLHPSATPAFDNEWDAHKIFQTPGYVGYPGPYTAYTTISSKGIANANEDYSINSFAQSQTQNTVIPVLVKVWQTGQFTIAPIDIQNLPANACVTLKDKLDNSDHDLRAGSYTFNISDTTQAARFVLTICADQTLPTGVQEAAAATDAVTISQDITGAFVKTDFAQNTKATISAYNVMGQKLMADKEVEGTQTTTYLNLDAHSQVVLIKVTTSKQSTVKRLFMN